MVCPNRSFAHRQALVGVDLEPLEARQLLSAVVDDRFEPNNVPRAVALLPAGGTNSANLGSVSGTRTLRQLVLDDAADVFRFALPRAGAAGDSASITFNNTRGNLDLELLGAGGRVLRSSLGNTNAETINLQGVAAGAYFVRVIGKAGAKSPNYRLDIVAPAPVTNPTGPTGPTNPTGPTGPTNPNDDLYEPNNSRPAVLAAATGGTSPNLGVATVRTISGLKLADKFDNYAFTLGTSGQVPSGVRIQGVNPLDLTLINANGQSVRATSAYQGQDTISFTGLQPGTYVLQVTHYALDTVGVFDYSLVFQA